MKNNPIIVTNSNPIGLDKVIEGFQNRISSLAYSNGNWFDGGLILGIVQKNEETEEPIIYWKGKDHFNATPKDFRSPLCFFYEDGSRKQSESRVTYSISMIIWFNESLIKQKTPRIKEYFINSVQKFFQKESVLDLEIFTINEQVFADFNIKTSKLFKKPNDGFRVKFNYDSKIDCDVGFSV